MPTISIFYGILIRMFFHDIEEHQEDLQADWALAVNGQNPLPIRGLDQ